MINNNIIVLGIGGGGANIVNYLSTKINDVEYLLIDNNMQLSYLQKIQEQISKISKIIIISTLGGAFTASNLPFIVKEIKEYGVEITAILTMPFAWQGAKRSDYADRTLKEVETLTNKCIIIHNQKFSKDLPPKTPLRVAYELVNEEVCRQINKLIKEDNLC